MYDESTDTPEQEAASPDGAPQGDPRDRFKQAAAEKQVDPADDHEDDLWSGSYSPKAMIGTWIFGVVASIAAIIIGLIAGAGGAAWGWILGGIPLLWVILAGLYGYRRLSVQYYLTSQRFIHESGLLWRTIDRVELIDIDDVTYFQGPIERLLGVGTIQVTSSDRSSPDLPLPGIDPVREVADLIDDARRKERRSRGLHIESV